MDGCSPGKVPLELSKVGRQAPVARPMKEIEINHGVWKIVVHVRLSLDECTKWVGSYEAEAPGHLPHKGTTAHYDRSDRALDRALGDALRDVVRN